MTRAHYKTYPVMWELHNCNAWRHSEMLYWAACLCCAASVGTCALLLLAKHMLTIRKWCVVFNRCSMSQRGTPPLCLTAICMGSCFVTSCNIYSVKISRCTSPRTQNGHMCCAGVASTFGLQAQNRQPNTHAFEGLSTYCFGFVAIKEIFWKIFSKVTSFDMSQPLLTQIQLVNLNKEFHL